MTTCPCCGQAIATRLSLSQIIEFVPLTPAQRRILTFLAPRIGHAVPTEVVLDHLYANDPNGGPDGAPATLRTHLFFLRNRLKPYGLGVKGFQSGRVMGGGRTLLYWLREEQGRDVA